MKIIFDIETNGLRDDCDKIWCIVWYDLENGVYGQIEAPTGRISGVDWKELTFIFNSSEVIIGHNIIGFDLPVLKELLGLNYHGEIFDTLVLSKLLNPDLDKFNPKVKKPHSLQAWGERLGIQKIPDLDWNEWNPEMLNRCKRDVDITYALYRHLGKELV